MRNSIDVVALMRERWPELKTDDGPDEERIARRLEERSHHYCFRLGAVVRRFEPLLGSDLREAAFLFDGESKVYAPPADRRVRIGEFLEYILKLGGGVVTKAGITGMVRYLADDAPYRMLGKKERLRFRRFYALETPGDGLAHVYRFSVPDRFYHHVAVSNPREFIGITALENYLEATAVARAAVEHYRGYIERDRAFPVRDRHLDHLIQKYRFLPALERYESYTRYRLSLTYF